MQLIEVQNAQHKKDFLNLVAKIYHEDTYYIRPLDNDIEQVFDSKRNKYFRHGDAIRYLLYENGLCIGRIAAFVNDKYSSQFPGVGGCGFFECIPKYDAAKMLFDAAKAWLQKKGMTAMDGPINFGERDKFWGIIIENFKQSPYYGQNYNPAYYCDFFAQYGFKEYYQQLIYTRSTTDKLADKFEERAQRLLSEPGYAVKCINKKDKVGLTEQFRTVYNKAWGKREGDNFKGMSLAQANSIMKALHPVLDEDLSYFAYHNNSAIGFYISIPDLNFIFKKFNGKFGWRQKIQFLYHLKTGACLNSIGLVFGVDPTYQGKGVEGLIFKFGSELLIEKRKYNDVVITWLGDFNVKMVKIIESLGGRMLQKMATLRYQFDENAVFERHPIKI